jgi:hypothetical protein
MTAQTAGPRLVQRESRRPEPRWTLHHGEALAILKSMPDASVDAVITDPPYSSGGFTRGDRTASTTAKYTLTGTQIERPAFAGDNRDQRSFGLKAWPLPILARAHVGARCRCQLSLNHFRVWQQSSPRSPYASLGPAGRRRFARRTHRHRRRERESGLRFQARLAHQSSDPFSTRMQPLLGQFVLNARSSAR